MHDPLIIEFEPIPAVGAKGAVIRNRIGACALDMFASRGYEGSSTRAIAERVDIKHSALLYHFGSKSNLWSYVMTGVIKQFRASVAGNIPSNPLDDPESALRGVINAMVDFSRIAPQLHKIMMMESTQYSDRLPWLVENQLQPHYELVTDLIKILQKEGKVWPVDPLRLYYSIIGISGMLSSAAHEIELLAGTDVFKDDELERTKNFLSTLVFTNGPKLRVRVKRTATY